MLILLFLILGPIEFQLDYLGGRCLRPPLAVSLSDTHLLHAVFEGHAAVVFFVEIGAPTADFDVAAGPIERGRFEPLTPTRHPNRLTRVPPFRIKVKIVHTGKAG